MLSPDYLESISDDILKIYDQLEDSILKDVIRRIVKTDYVTDTAKWQLEQLQNSGMVYQDAMTQISKITGKSDAELKSLFEEAAVENLKYDNEIYQAAGLTAIPLSQSPAMLQMLTAGLTKTSGTLRNLTMTTATAAQTAYINASNLAYMQVSSGAFSRTEAIKNAIRQAAWQGSSVLYPSGHVDQLDVAVRRATLTGVNQTMANVSIANMENMGTDLVQVTAHSGARPSHAEWQGKVYSLSGTTEKYGDFYKETGYGTGDGLCGWNCRHNFYPFIEGIDEEMYSASDLEKLNEAKYEYNGKKYTEYEVTQRQRAMERNIRQTRRELIAYDTAMKETLFDELKDSIKSDFNITAVKIKGQESALKNLLKQTGIRNKTDRLQVAGFGRSISQKAVAASKRLEKQRQHAIMVAEIKKDCGITGEYHIPSKIVSVKYYSFDADHINKQRAHNVTFEEAISFIDSSLVSIERWNGRFVNYYSQKGATYIDTENGIIRTAFKKDEFDEKTLLLMEELKKHGIL